MSGRYEEKRVSVGWQCVGPESSKLPEDFSKGSTEMSDRTYITLILVHVVIVLFFISYC